jgi:hypothetical protein
MGNFYIAEVTSVRPRFGARVHEVPRGIFCRTLQRHGASCCTELSAPTDPVYGLAPGCWPYSQHPWTLAQREPVRVGSVPSYPKPDPIQRTVCPARLPQAMRCVTEAAIVRANSGSLSRNGSYPVAIAASLPASRYPSWRSLPMTHRTDLLEHCRHVSIAGRLDLDKARPEALVGAIKIDLLTARPVSAASGVPGSAPLIKRRGGLPLPRLGCQATLS